MQSLQKEIKKTFLQTLEDLDSKENLENFFEDFLTKEEFDSFAKRLAIAYWLKKKRTSENIKVNLKANIKEIKEVKQKLSTKGYKLALKYMEAEEWANVWGEKISKFRLNKNKFTK